MNSANKVITIYGGTNTSRPSSFTAGCSLSFLYTTHKINNFIWNLLYIGGQLSSAVDIKHLIITCSTSP